MRNYRWFALLSIILLGLLVAACGSSPGTQEQPASQEGSSSVREDPSSEAEQQPQETFQLEFGLWTPATHHLHEETAKPWKQLVEEKTGGRVIVNLYPGGTLGSSRATWEDVSGGVYDIGVLCHIYYPDGPFFIPAISDLPFAYGNATSTESTRVLNKFMDQYGFEKFEELAGVKIMSMITTDPYYFLSTKPIQDAAGFRGLKIRVPGAGWDAVYKEWEAVPVSVTVEDSYTSLERGTLDVMNYSLVGTYGWKYHEVAPHLVDLAAFRVSCSWVMNMDVYEQFPADLRQMFDEEFNAALGEISANAYTTKTEETRRAIENEGGQFIQLSQEDEETLANAAKAAWTNYINEANSRGLDGEQMIADFFAVLREEGIEPPFSESDFGVPQ